MLHLRTRPVLVKMPHGYPRCYRTCHLLGFVGCFVPIRSGRVPPASLLERFLKKDDFGCWSCCEVVHCHKWSYFFVPVFYFGSQVCCGFISVGRTVGVGAPMTVVIVVLYFDALDRTRGAGGETRRLGRRTRGDLDRGSCVGTHCLFGGTCRTFTAHRSCPRTMRYNVRTGKLCVHRGFCGRNFRLYHSVSRLI